MSEVRATPPGGYARHSDWRRAPIGFDEPAVARSPGLAISGAFSRRCRDESRRVTGCESGVLRHQGHLRKRGERGGSPERDCTAYAGWPFAGRLRDVAGLQWRFTNFPKRNGTSDMPRGRKVCVRSPAQASCGGCSLGHSWWRRPQDPWRAAPLGLAYGGARRPSPRPRKPVRGGLSRSPTRTPPTCVIRRGGPPDDAFASSPRGRARSRQTRATRWCRDPAPRSTSRRPRGTSAASPGAGSSV
jgi:hypothetical protein